MLPFSAALTDWMDQVLAPLTDSGIVTAVPGVVLTLAPTAFIVGVGVTVTATDDVDVFVPSVIS